MPIFSRSSGSWHCAGSGAVVLALALSAFWPVLILDSWTAWLLAAVAAFPFDDHTAPNLSILSQFCANLVRAPPSIKKPCRTH